MLLRLLASALGADTRERDRLRDDHELVAFLVGTVSSANADGVAVANALRALLHLVAHSQQPLAELLFSTVRGRPLGRGRAGTGQSRRTPRRCRP